MQITDTDLIAYLKHRIGEEKIRPPQRKIVRKALELNKPVQDIDLSFGTSELPAYVGFLDLYGFSVAVHGKSPTSIANYLRPFLSRVIEILRGRHLLIDKTIGDEIMFVLPEIGEEGNGHEILYLGQVMGALHDLAFEFGGVYKYRIGLAYGQVSFFHIDGNGYSEWTTVGEVVQLAKRLHSLEQLQEPNPVCGAFAMACNDTDIEQIRVGMENRLGIFAGIASRFDHTILPEPVKFKGVGKALCALLLARPERAKSTMPEQL